MRASPMRFSMALLLAVICLLGAVLSVGLAVAQQDSGDRFDFKVRADMFAGLAGDNAALDRAMKLCEQTLAKEPENAEALVWHGSGLVFQGGQSMRAGDYARGMSLTSSGLREMDAAVAKQPDRVGVLIPRGATLLEYSKHDPRPDFARATLEKGLADYEKVLTLQKSYWQTLPVHARGELLSGLAEGWLRAGDSGKANSYMQRLLQDTAGSDYAARAQNFLNAATPPKQLDWHCIGCHIPAAKE